MKESKGVYVTKQDIRENQLNRNYQLLYTSKVTRDYKYETGTREAGVQYNYRRDNNVFCTCRNTPGLRRHQEVRYFSGYPKQVYAYHGSRSYTDIGVGSVKAFQRKKVKRIYLPETDDRGVGSSDLSSFINRRTRFYRSSYYDHKKTSSKCVGGLNEANAEFLNEKLSPIVHTRSGATSPSVPLSEDLKKNVEIGSNTYEKSFVTTSTQIQDDLYKEEDNKSAKVVEGTEEQVKVVSKDNTKKTKEVETVVEGKRISKRAQEAERVFSSDSLVQHVHNLEHPSEDKQSPMSIDPMENKLEREYRKMFCTKSKESKDQKSSQEKNVCDMKSTSVLKRRFEALRRGLAKKEDSKRNAVLAARESSNVSSPSHKDVSIASDPPSLEGRSYSNTKIYSPFSNMNPEKNASKYVYKKPGTSKPWSRTEEIDSDYQNAKGMFKLWGKKFNLDDEECSPGASVEISKKSKDSKVPSIDSESKKEGKKFFFFKRRSKDKTKQPYKQKKGVTAGRCEVGDGLMIKIGAANTPPPIEKHEKRERKVIDKIPEEYEEMLRKAWLQQFLARTIESRNSVKIRWNNNAYATSSSTVFEIMENVYKDTGVVFRSKSEVTTGESSYYRSFTKQRVNFVQDIEAWMIPKFIPDRMRGMPLRARSDEKGDKNDNIEVTISDQKWIIDKSKAFAQKIEVVLHSNNVVKPCMDSSSEYLRIDIPKGFFSNSSTDSTGQMQTSNEEVFKIVEYELPESNSAIQKNSLNTGDHVTKDIKVTVSVKENCDVESKILETVIKRPPIHRDVVIQGSNVHIPKLCNVIGVGIITQKDISRIRKPILKIQDDYSDEESEPAVPQYQNKSKFAESYLQDYYRHWTPLGMDFFSWCVSDSHLKCCSENSHTTVNQQGDGSKSCPNIYDDYQTSAIVSSCGTSCCSQCAPWMSEDAKEVQPKRCKFFSRFKSSKNNNKNAKHEPDQSSFKRVHPKDSLEVSKRRKYVNECSNKSKWSCGPEDSPFSVPSMESIGAQDTLGDCPKSPKRSCYKPSTLQKKKVCNKHVSLPNCDSDPHVQKCGPAGILSFKGSSKCDFCRQTGKGECPKHTKTEPKPTCEIPPPDMPCKEILKTPPNTRIPTCPPSPPRCPSPPPCPSPPICDSRHSEQLVACASPSQLSPLQKGCRPPPCKQKKPGCVPHMSGRKPPSPCPASPPKCRSPPAKKAKCRSASPLPSCPNVSKPRPSPSPPPCKKPSPPPCAPPPCPKSPSPKSPSPRSSPCLKQSPPRSKPATPPCCPKPCPPRPLTPPSPPPCKPKAVTPPCLSPPPAQKPASPCPPKPPSPTNSCPPTPPKPPCPPQPECPPKTSPPPCPPQPGRPKPSCPPKRCNTPPCKPEKPPRPPCTACKKCPSQDFPWPTKNQISNQPSLQSVCPPTSNSKCKKNCSFLPDCPKPKPCPRRCNTASKVSGLFLKMKPSKKTCSKECSAWNAPQSPDRCRSEDNFSIQIKQGTVSTEEIREEMHIKVQDEDGRTLYERVDYQKHRPSVLNDMYESNVHTVSTSIVQNMALQEQQSNQEIQEAKSEVSVANLIEINFKLKVTQGDKMTEINIGNDGVVEKPKADTKNQIGQTSHEVFMLKDEAEQCTEEQNDKNDINIKIVIKNYKPKRKNDGKNYSVDVEDFTQKISEKFHTVSTGYSNVGGENQQEEQNVEQTENIEKDESLAIEEDVKHVYSVHRATINLTSSNDMSKTQVTSIEAMSGEEFIERDLIMTSLSATDKSATEHSVSKIDDVQNKNENDVDDIQKFYKNTCYDDKGRANYSMTDVEDQELPVDTNNTSDEPVSEGNNTDVIPTSLTKEEKKRILKKLFEKACKSKKMKYKDRTKQLRDMLKIILTSDSSDHDDNVTSNELVKEMTYASLKPNYFRDTDSMNNYYSSVISSAKDVKQNLVYPTQNDSECSVASDAASSEENVKGDKGCYCSTLAARLNMCEKDVNGVCCCRKAVVKKVDVETCCDLRTEEDFFLLNYKTIECTDVETQNSKFICNSTNISVHSKAISGPLRDYADLAPKVTEIANTSKEMRVMRVRKTFSPHAAHIRPCEMKKLNRNTVLGISDEDKVYLLNAKPTNVSIRDVSREAKSKKRSKSKDNVKSRKKKSKFEKPADVLQCYETKKAVLEIYTEKTVSNAEERLVAKLPKFVYDKESEIERNYGEFAENSYRALKRDVVMMSIKR